MTSPNDVVLGIDPGLATTGWGVVVGNVSQVRLRAFGAVSTPSKEPLPARLQQIRRELLRLINIHQPSVITLEELFFTKFATSIAATAQARGVILLTAADSGVPVVAYNPRAVKMAMTGFGSANKAQMQSMIQRRFNLEEVPQPDDAADAISIALCHLQTHPELRGSSRRKSKADFDRELAARAGVDL